MSASEHTVAANRSLLSELPFADQTHEARRGLMADAAGEVRAGVDAAPVQALLTNLDDFEFWFPIVTPRPPRA